MYENDCCHCKEGSAGEGDLGPAGSHLYEDRSVKEEEKRKDNSNSKAYCAIMNSENRARATGASQGASLLRIGLRERIRDRHYQGPYTKPRQAVSNFRAKCVRTPVSLELPSSGMLGTCPGPLACRSPSSFLDSLKSSKRTTVLGISSTPDNEAPTITSLQLSRVSRIQAPQRIYSEWYAATVYTAAWNRLGG